MLRNIFLKTLRDLRWSILVWSVGLGIIVTTDIVFYPQYSQNPQQLSEMTKAYEAFGFLLGETVPVNTLGAFLTLETLAYFPVMLGLWGIVAGVGLIRGEEEQGALDMLMSTPHSRVSTFLQKAAALGVALTAATSIIGVIIYLALVISNQTMPFGGTIAALVNMLVCALFWGAVGLFAGQVSGTRRATSLAVGGILLGTFLLNNTAESISSLKWLTWIMPSHYYNLSKPLVPGRAIDAWALLALLGAALLFTLIAVWMYVRRDLGDKFALWPARKTTRVSLGSLALLHSVFAKSLRDQLGSMLGWGLSLGALGAVIVGTTKEALAPMYGIMNSIPWFTKMFGKMDTNEAYLAVGLFSYLPLMIVVLALTQVWGWASDEEEGRLDLLVSEPLPRWQIILARYVASVISLVGVLAITLLSILAVARIANVELNARHIVDAIAATAPLALVALAFGLAVATWLARPGPAVAVTGGAVIVMFFISTLAPLFEWPEAVRRLSIFYLYGRPIAEGIPWGNMAILTTATFVFAVLSIAGVQRRDIAK